MAAVESPAWVCEGRTLVVQERLHGQSCGVGTVRVEISLNVARPLAAPTGLGRHPRLHAVPLP
ncbi:hypothetical protein VR45_20900 [Streptomyces sp. NRRL S-495]|nr:hypothetical protein VR45_20900 [Streptomyces sp. NRRL S-495]